MDYNSIINSNNVVLVEFFATWCPHCKRMIPVMEEVKTSWQPGPCVHYRH